MCSIPEPPPPGSEVHVLIIRVNLNPRYGLVELWVNMDDGRKDIYEQMRQEIQSPERVFDGSEGKAGEFCLVRISDMWHRARIVSVHSEAYYVFLIDQGQPHNATSDNLAWAPCESFLLPPETESCILSNVIFSEKKPSEKAAQFLKSLPGNKYKGMIQDVLMPEDARKILLDIPTISKSLCESGLPGNIHKDEFKSLVLKCLFLQGKVSEDSKVGCQVEKHDQYFYPELLVDTFETVTVPWVTGPQGIFCKIFIFSKAVEILSEQIQQHYQEMAEEVTPRTQGDPCAARDADGRWRRSFLKQSILNKDDAVEVLHVDTGKTESVPVRNIRSLHGKFLRMPVVTYRCVLSGLNGNALGLTTDQVDDLKSQLLNQTLMARFHHHDITQGIYDVTLYTAYGTCINNHFLEKAGLPTKDELGTDARTEATLPSFFSSFVEDQCTDLQNKPTPIIHNSEQLSTTYYSEVGDTCDEDVFTVGSRISVNVSCFESLQKFWCQSTENGECLRLLMQDLQNHYASVHPQPAAESICVARNPDNGMWYRARMTTNAQSPVVDVRLIDYGQKLKVPLQDVRPIDPAFLRLDALAFQCSLYDLKNSSSSTPAITTDDAIAEFLKFVDSDSKSNGLEFVVDAVTSEGLLVNFINQETSADDVCKLLAQECAQAENGSQSQVKERIETEQQNKTGTDTQIDQQCSQSSEQSSEPDKDRLTQDPTSVSVEHSSNGVCPSDEQKENSLSLLKDVVGDIEFEAGKMLEVIFEENESVLTKTLIEGSDSEISELSPPSCHGSNTNICMHRGTDIVQNNTEVYASCIAGPHFFWCQYANTEDLDKLSILAQEAGQAQQDTMCIETLGPGSPCLALFSSDDQWYRARVIHKKDNSLHVVFIDYGNESDVDIKNVRPLRQNLLEMAPQAFLCSLHGFDESQGTWDDKVYDDFYNLLVDKKLTVTVSSMDNHSAIDVLQYSVQLECESVDVNEAVKKYWRPCVSETVKTESLQIKNNPQVSHSEPNTTQPKETKGNPKTPKYKKPQISKNQAGSAFASCIVGPHFFWCQYANTEDLVKLSILAQEARRAQQDTSFTDTLGPGSPCLAFIPTDKEWYRAQVIHRKDNSLHVVFIDYGNECDVDIKNVRPLPQILLDMAPQAFLCSLNGFDKSKGTWDDQVYDDFYNLLVDKPLSITVLHLEDPSESDIPQYSVQVECENVLVNNTVKKYWNPVARERVKTKSPQTTDSIQVSQTESTITQPHDSESKPSEYKKPQISPNQTESAYASCIVSPHFFWCQYANTEDLDKLSNLAQESGQAQQDTMFSENLGPGSPCLALFSSDDQWYRSQVIKTNENNLQVVFIDYGNESDVDIKNVRRLPQDLLETAPQAFLCSLHGFDKSKGTWDDKVYDDFYNLLVDKPLRVTVLNIENNSESDVPLYEVSVYTEGVDVNSLMEKYWKGLDPNHTRI